MPRRARNFQRAICYHLMNRGVNRLPIFEDDKDREYFSRLVRYYKEMCGAHVYHWAWMHNHYHILAAVTYDNLRAFTGGIQQCFAQYHHARHKTCGVFWQGRFKSKPVEIGAYLAVCGRYIERNPVRMGLVLQAWDYQWSSAAAYVKQATDDITDLNPYLGDFTPRDRRNYRKLLMLDETDRDMRAYEHSSFIGAPAFAKTLILSRGHYRIKRGRPVKNV